MAAGYEGVRERCCEGRCECEGVGGTRVAEPFKKGEKVKFLVDTGTTDMGNQAGRVGSENGMRFLASVAWRLSIFLVFEGPTLF